MTPDDSIRLSLQDIIKSNIDAKYMADYGTVTAVYGTPVATVDVQHNAYGFIDTNGNPQPNFSYAVEVLYPATAGFSMEYPVAVGDGVLLIGMRRYVKTVATPAPVTPIQYASYAKDTLKAIPLSDLTAGSTMYMRSKGGKLQVKNATQSLYTVLNNLITHISSLVTINCVVGSPLTLNPATIANLASDAAALSAILEA